MALTILYSKLYKLLKYYYDYCQDIKWFTWKKVAFLIIHWKKVTLARNYFILGLASGTYI